MNAQTKRTNEVKKALAPLGVELFVKSVRMYAGAFDTLTTIFSTVSVSAEKIAQTLTDAGYTVNAKYAASGFVTIGWAKA